MREIKSFFEVFYSFRSSVWHRLFKNEKRIYKLEKDISILEDKIRGLEVVFIDIPAEIAADMQIASGQMGYSSVNEEELS